MIFSIIAILIMIYSLIDIKRGFLLFLLYQLIWFPDAQLFKIQGLASINLNLIVSVFFIFLYIIKRYASSELYGIGTAWKKLQAKKKKLFPFKNPMFAIGMSLIITCFTSVSGFEHEFVRAVGLIFINLITIYLIWQLVETKKDFDFLFKGITIIIFMACLYEMIEYVTRNNPLLIYKFSLAGNQLTSYQIGARGYRAYSIFEHPIAAAMIFSLYIIFVMTCIIVYKEKLPFKTLAIITSVLCIPCIILTKMRTGFVFLAIGMFAFIDFRSKRFWKIAIALVIVILAITPVILDNAILFTSLFDKNAQAAMGGSNPLMRFTQFDAVFQIMKMSPIAGLGEKFRTIISNDYVTRALDFESLWFEQMAKHGLVGVLAYIYMIYYSIYKVPKKYKSKQILFVSLAYWGTYTLTSTPYFRVYLFYLAIFYFIKKSNIYQRALLNHNIHQRDSLITLENNLQIPEETYEFR